MPVHDGGAPEFAVLLRHIEAAAPELPAAVAARALLTAAPTGQVRRLLRIALDRRPGILTGARADVPVAAQRLTHALIAAGAIRVIAPSCEDCGRQLIMPNKTSNGGRRCARCLGIATAVPCPRCGTVTRVQRTVDGESLCRSCWRVDSRSFAICSRCGKNATVAVRRPKVVCLACYTPPLRTCTLCHEEGKVATRSPAGPVCFNCYFRMRYPHTCPGCGRRRLLEHIRDGETICGDCAGTPDTLACPGCGSVEHARKHRLCTECRRPAVIAQLVEDGTGRIRAPWDRLRDYLLQRRDRADSLERWARKSRARAVLRDLVEGDLPLRPDAILDQMGETAGSVFLLSVLSEAQVLENLDIAMTRDEWWLRRWLSSIPNRANRLLLRRYAAWATTFNSSQRRRRNRVALRYCSDLLDAIGGAGHTVATFPQRRFDAFLTGSTSQHDALAHFTGWMRDQRISQLRLANRPNALQGAGLDRERHRRAVRTLARDTTAPPVDRVAGLLLLLYAQPLTRVTALRRDAVKVSGDTVTVTLGEDPITVPPPLANALRDLVESVDAREHTASGWLFPGRNHGQHLTVAGLARRLSRYDIRSADAHATALFGLAQHMNVRVLADLLGISPATASRWRDLTGVRWAHYPDLRAAPSTSP